MTAPPRRTWRTSLTSQDFVVDYLQMLAAMGVGMIALEPASMRLVHHGGPEVHTLLMATTMAAGMALWMAYRGHGWARVVEMTAVMYAAFAVLFPLSWLGVVSANGLMVLGHVLMLLGTAVVLLHRRAEHPAAR